MADTIETLEIEIKHRASGAAAEIKKVTSAIRGMGQAAKKTKSPLENFLSSLKRIAFYRFIRSIIKGIVQAFQEGLQQAYAFSSGIAGDSHRFAEALDKMKSSGNQLKGQLGAAFAALLTAIEPILTRIINLAIQVADAITQLLSAFTGHRYLKATNTAAKFADTMKSGAGAAKEWRNQLMGFDEINRLNEPSSGGGGGGGGDNGFGFEDAEISDFWKNFAAHPLQAIKEAFEKLSDWIENYDWQELGANFWKKIKEIFSDSGEADGVVAAFFRALGSAFGAVLGFAWGFIKESVKDIYRQFKNNIVDYDGDNKIGLLDVLKGIWKTTTAPIEWINANIVDPFLTGVIKAFSSKGGKPAMGWNEFWNWLFVDKLGLPPADTIGEAGKNIVEGLIQGAKDFLNETGLLLFGNLWYDIIDGCKLIFGINSPSTVFADIGVNIMLGLIGGLNSMFGSLSSTISGIFGSIISWCQSAHSWIQDIITGIGIVGSSNIGWHGNGGHSGISGKFASGGFPDEGQLFIAREDGAEMVGSLGGRTAVANNDQIVEGIRQGVYEAVMAANSNGNSNFEVRVYLDSREIKVGQQNLARAMG